MGEDKLIFIPKQRVAVWKNNEGVILRIVQYFDLEDLVISRVFMDQVSFNGLNVKEFMGTPKKPIVVTATFVLDDEDRQNLKALKEAGNINDVDFSI